MSNRGKATRAQREQRQLAWLLYTTLGARGNLRSAAHRARDVPPVTHEVAMRTAAALAEFADHLSHQLNSIQKDFPDDATHAPRHTSRRGQLPLLF